MLGGQEIKNINNFGTVFETLSHLRNIEFRKSSGSKESFIPDTGSGETAIANNLGYKERQEYYNYAPADANTFREVTVFVPLHSIFGFCKDHARVLRNIPLDITLTRLSHFNNCFFGADHTNVDFELTNILLRIEYVIPNDKIIVALNNFLESNDPLNAYYLAKSCDKFSGTVGTFIDINLGLRYSNPRYFIIACKDSANENSL